MPEKRLKVLHLEDSWAISLTLEQEYRAAGLEPKVVRNTRDAMKEMKKGQFDVYVTDLLVPHHKEGDVEITPLSLLLIAQERNPSAPRLIFSDTHMSDKLEGVEFIPKSQGMEKLIRHVAKAGLHSRSRDAEKPRQIDVEQWRKAIAHAHPSMGKEMLVGLIGKYSADPNALQMLMSGWRPAHHGHTHHHEEFELLDPGPPTPQRRKGARG